MLDIFGLRLVCYSLATIGVWLIIKPIVEPNIRVLSNTLDKKLRLRIIKGAAALETNKKMSAIYRHLDRMLYLVKKDYDPGVSVVRFFMTVLGYFLSTFFVLIMTVGDLPGSLQFQNPFSDPVFIEYKESKFFWQFPFVMAVIAAIIPYLVLRYRFNHYNILASYDLLEVVKMMTRSIQGHRNYQIHEALRLTADMLSTSNVLRRPLYILSNAFLSYSNFGEIKAALFKFDSIIGTTFSKIFANSLMFAEQNGGKNLAKSFLHLANNMEDQLQTVIDSHKHARDPILLGKYGGLITFFVVIPVAALSLGVDTYLKLQFKTVLGLGLFASIVVSIFLSFVLSLAISKPKLDYF